MIERSGPVPIVEIIGWSEMVGLESRGPGWLLESGDRRRFFWTRHMNEMQGVGVIHITEYTHSTLRTCNDVVFGFWVEKLRFPGSEPVSGCETLQEED